MNRILRSGGSWDKRNGSKGIGIAWQWDYLNEVLPDTVNLQTNLLQFEYTPEATNPIGSQTDTVNLDADIVNFSYTV